MEDIQIVTLFWDRDESAIKEVDLKYHNLCYGIAWNLLSNNEDSEECVNDTWMKAWQSIPPTIPECLRIFLGKITRNLALNRVKYYEAKRRGWGQTEKALEELMECIPTTMDVEQQFSETLVIKVLEDFLMEQPKEQRNIFVRRYWYMMPIKEIADAYGISESKAMSLLYRMRKKLKKYLEKEGITL